MTKKNKVEKNGEGIQHRSIQDFEFVKNEVVDNINTMEDELIFSIVAKGPGSVVVQVSPIDLRKLIEAGRIFSLDKTDESSREYPIIGERATVADRKKKMSDFWNKNASFEVLEFVANGCKFDSRYISLGKTGNLVLTDGQCRSSAIEGADIDHPVFSSGTSFLLMIGTESSKRIVANYFLKQNDCRANVTKSTNAAVGLATIEEGEKIGLEDNRYAGWVTSLLSKMNDSDSLLDYLGWTIEGSRYREPSTIPSFDKQKSFRMGNLSSLVTIFSEDTIRSLIKSLNIDPEEVPKIISFGFKMWNKMSRESIFELLQKGKSSKIRLLTSLGIKTICGLTLGVWKKSGYNEEEFVKLTHEHIASVSSSNQDLFFKECLTPNDLWHTHKVLSGDFFNSGAMNAEKGLMPLLRPFFAS